MRSTDTLVKALRDLSKSIEMEDGGINLVIAEALSLP